MRQMQPVLWTKGILLSPQHLQTQDRFVEDLLEFRCSTLAFAPWGFQRLRIDHEALAGGSISIVAARGIFPDGLLFDAPDADAVPAPKPLEGGWEQDQEHLDIYLAVPEYRHGGFNVSAGANDAQTRYRASVLLRRDENTGLGEKPIQVARKNLRLLTSNESLEGSSAMRIARVRRDSSGQYELDPRFVPPLLDIAASDHLLGIARRLVEILAARSGTLAGTRRQRNQSLAEFGIADVASFWLLYTINSHLPQLRHLFETRRGHPCDLFQAMLGLAGALTTFSTTVHPRQLPAYDHDDLTSCFTTLDEMLRELLETVVPATSVSLPLRQVQPSVWATALDEERYLAAPQLYLAVNAPGARADLWPSLPHLAKVSSADRVDHLIRQALPGVALTHLPQPPTAIPIKVSHHYFRLDATGREWESIARARNLAVYLPSDFGDSRVELIVILGQK
ncbi:MAG TPA: type VI secretion system baseplate subunit TssK [Gemmatimonadaceae bacterium]|nr:type VI secretion system baseplate subunit TssK [Gemmatimonadaceae bacterium]